jgi:hypothetical protein
MRNLRGLDWPLAGMAALLTVALFKAAVGLMVIIDDPGILMESSRAGIPRWQPAAVSAWLILAAVQTWIANGLFGSLSVLWALGAAAFAHPALSEAGQDVPPIELLLIPWAAVAAWHGWLSYQASHPSIRRVIAWTGGVLVGVFVVMWTPAGWTVAQAVAAAAYVAIVAASLATSETSYRIRRFKWQHHTRQ